MTFVANESLDMKERIVKRFLEIYETSQEIKDLFNSFFKSDSAIKTMIDIDSIEKKKEVAGILVDYLGMNFFSTAGKNYNVGPHMKEEDGKYLTREKLLEQICKRHGDPESKKKNILEELNHIFCSGYADFKEMSRHKRFLKKESIEKLREIFDFPQIVFESPPKKSKEEETTTVSKKLPIKPLYDYQTQAVVRITEMLSEKDKGKRILISIPTGAGKTRLSVEAIINWINDREHGRIPNTSPQQKNGRIIFWFASTNELCSQAASEFVNLYTQIGAGGSPFNVTRLYGSGRNDIFTILDENPGTHIVVTNTEHFQKFLNYEKENAKYQVDQYEKSDLFRYIRERTAAIIIDEAHEAIAPTYRKFLAAMGFDFSGRQGKKNRNDIVLIGLTATPYRGSGKLDREPNDLSEIDEFVDSDKSKDPDYFKYLDKDTKRIHKMFGHVYIPIPEEGHRKPEPVPAIEAPSYAHTNEHVRISGMNSFDNFSELEYDWTIGGFGGKQASHDEPVFYHKFDESGKYNIKLVVTNKDGRNQTKIHPIEIYPSKRSQQGTGNLNDNKEFNRILQNRDILCKIIYGIIDGPQLRWDKHEIQMWKKGEMSEDNEAIIDNDRKYNEHICDIIDKAIHKHGRKRVLVFANGVSHSHNLALILSAKYKIDAKSVDSKMNAGLRRQTIHDFRTGKISVLCNHGILTSGFDVPEIDTLLICRTVGSNALYTQMIGRGQRGTVAGGTKDLWLITAYFKKGEFDDMRLGWEALADTWEKFPESIKADLKVKDSLYVTSSTVADPKPLDDKKTFICKKCKFTITRSKETYKQSNDDSKSANRHSNKTKFATYCNTCYKIISIAKNSSCEYCKLLADHHNYDFNIISIVKFVNNNQNNKKDKRFQDLQNWLYEKWHKKIPMEMLGIRNASIQKSHSIKLIDIKDNMMLKCPRIADQDALNNIIECLVNSEQLKMNIEKRLANIETYRYKEQSKSSLKTLLEKLTIQYGHTPTTRQFNDATLTKEQINEFKDTYNSNYSKLLREHGIILKDDHELKDSLYNEYFEKCLSVGEEITRKQLDEHGQHRISDYEEIFGPFGEFQNKVEHVLKKVLNRDVKESYIEDEFRAIDSDLLALSTKLGRWPNFDDLRVHSAIGAYRYPTRLNISCLRYLKNYNGDKPGKFLRMVTEFFRLKEILGVVPTSKDFTNLTPPSPTADLGELFGFKYDRFLLIIRETLQDYDPEHVEYMKEQTLQKLQHLQDKSSVDEVCKIIDDSDRNYDELSIRIKAWWPDRKLLKDTLSPTLNISS